MRNISVIGCTRPSARGRSRSGRRPAAAMSPSPVQSTIVRARITIGPDLVSNTTPGTAASATTPLAKAWNRNWTPGLVQQVERGELEPLRVERHHVAGRERGRDARRRRRPAAPAAAPARPPPPARPGRDRSATAWSRRAARTPRAGCGTTSAASPAPRWRCRRESRSARRGSPRRRPRRRRAPRRARPARRRPPARRSRRRPCAVRGGSVIAGCGGVRAGQGLAWARPGSGRAARADDRLARAADRDALRLQRALLQRRQRRPIRACSSGAGPRTGRCGRSGGRR